MHKLTKEQFIFKAQRVHGDKYDYSKVDYLTNSTKVCIICPKHGEFWQTPANHLYGKGCKDCKREKLKKTMFGIAFNDYNERIWDNNSKKMIPSYIAWRSMLTRCYDKKYHKKYPSYIGCYVCEDWLYYSNFKSWYDKNSVQGWHIDKDILFKGNKVYSSKTCCFVPPEINTALTNCASKRGNNLIGVYEYEKGKFVSTYHKKYLGTSNDEMKLFFKYKLQKEQNLKSLAEKYKGQIKRDVYNALINYQIEEGD